MTKNEIRMLVKETIRIMDKALMVQTLDQKEGNELEKYLFVREAIRQAVDKLQYAKRYAFDIEARLAVFQYALREYERVVEGANN